MRGRYSRLRGKGISLLTTAAVMCVMMSGCGQTEETEETMSEVIPVQVQQPVAGKLTIKNEFVGTISPEESVYVIPMVSAEVLSTNVSVGDVVAAGDILCELDSEAAKLQLASAQAQYDSAEAGVNSAQVGYEMAQAQYESAVAQSDAQMGGQKNLQMYQLQIQNETVQRSIDDLYEQKADLEEQKEDAQEQKDDLKDSRNAANERVQAAQAAYIAARAQVTAMETTDPDAVNALITKYGDETKYKQALENAKSACTAAQADFEQAVTAAAQTSSAYEQAKSGITQIEDGEEQLDSALADAYKQLEQAEAIMNITEEQVYEDTQKVIDANKKTAALGIDSAAAGVNSAQVGVEGAQVAIDSAEYQLDMYTLKAPIDGIIEAANLDEHDLASPGTPAYVISNKNAMTVTFYVSEGIRNTLTVGQKISVDRNGKPYDAAVTEIGSMVDQNTGLFAVKASVSGADDSLLTGCSVKVTADTYSQDDALLIPYDAVYYDDSQSYVYVAVGDTVERRDIETGIFDEETITVLSGLTTDDQLITSWSANLREGALISIQQAQDPAGSEG